MQVVKTETNSALIDTKQGFNVWVDCWINGEGEVETDWNKYIFRTDNEEDMKIKAFQEDCNNFDEASSLAIDVLQSLDKLTINN